MRPADISNRIRLTYKVRAAIRSLVAERGTIDTRLPLSGPTVDTVVSELPPDEESGAVERPQDDVFPGAAEQASDTPVSVAMCGVVLLIELQTRPIAVLRQPPQRFELVCPQNTLLMPIIRFALGMTSPLP